jgi:hypothetical protein
MRIPVRITSGTAERTLARDLNRQHGDPAGQDSPPGCKHLTWSKTWVRDGWTHTALMLSDRPWLH